MNSICFVFLKGNYIVIIYMLCYKAAAEAKRLRLKAALRKRASRGSAFSTEYGSDSGPNITLWTTAFPPSVLLLQMSGRKHKRRIPLMEYSLKTNTPSLHHKDYSPLHCFFFVFFYSIRWKDHGLLNYSRNIKRNVSIWHVKTSLMCPILESSWAHLPHLFLHFLAELVWNCD